MSWVEIPLEVRGNTALATGTGENGIRSETMKRFFSNNLYYTGWVIVICPNTYYDNVYQNEDGYVVRDWRIELPCFCKKERGIISSVPAIPVTVEHLTIGCKTCNKETVRVSGLVTMEWKLLVCDELYGVVT